jgi:hypothetical protein
MQISPVRPACTASDLDTAESFRCQLGRPAAAAVYFSDYVESFSNIYSATTGTQRGGHDMLFFRRGPRALRGEYSDCCNRTPNEQKPIGRTGIHSRPEYKEAEVLRQAQRSQTDCLPAEIQFILLARI